MKIAVIAASGRTGQAFVAAALNSGHFVRAGVHNRNRLEANNNLEIVDCDAQNYEEIRRLITGCDAVASFIGHVRSSAPDVQTIAIQNLIKAMKAEEIRRVVSLTGTGVRFAGDQITLMDRFLNLGIALVDPKRVKDGINHVELLKQSGLDWTVIRVLKLTGSKLGNFNLKSGGPAKTFVSRSTVAKAALQVLEAGSYTAQAPIISP